MPVVTGDDMTTDFEHCNYTSQAPIPFIHSYMFIQISYRMCSIGTYLYQLGHLTPLPEQPLQLAVSRFSQSLVKVNADVILQTLWCLADCLSHHHGLLLHCQPIL